MKVNLKKGINAVVMVVASLGLTAITIGIYAIVVQAFRNSQITSVAGCNRTTAIGCGYAYNASNEGLKMFTGLTSQFNTIGQVSGVLILFGVMALFGIGGYMAYQKYGPGGAA